MSNLLLASNKIVARGAGLSELCSSYRLKNQKIVFTNGCFDILHRGHIEYLSRAKDEGDILIVGLNTDDSVRKLKGPDRPLQDENSRALVLSSLFFIDYVVLFAEDTPFELISEIQPDILVKGADYKVEDIVGYDIVMARGGAVKTISFVEGHSSSAIINKLG